VTEQLPGEAQRFRYRVKEGLEGRTTPIRVVAGSPPISLDQYGATLASWFGVAGSALTTEFLNLNNLQKQNLEFMSD